MDRSTNARSRVPLFLVSQGPAVFLQIVFIMEYKQLTPMFIITDKRFTTLGNKIYEFMSVVFPQLTETDIEVIHTDLTEDNVFGWTLINNDQNEIEIHNDLSERDYVTTLIHELVHVKQNVNGVTDDTIREGEAYELENTLADIYLTGNSYRMLKQC